jgi:hypothetical protein
VLNKKPQNNLQVTKNRVSDTTKAIAHSSQNLNSVISAANVGDNTRKFAALDHNPTSLSILPCKISGYFLALGKLFASVNEGPGNLKKHLVETPSKVQ